MADWADANDRPDAWRARLVEQARACSSLLFSLSYKVLGDKSAAEDACQKTILKAWEQRQQIADPERLRGWLAKTVINESLAILRRRKVESRVLKLAAVGAAAHTSVESVAENLDLRQAVVIALNDLQDDERAAVALRIMQGISTKDASVLLGVSNGQVSKLLHRGMERLRQILAEWDERSE